MTTFIRLAWALGMVFTCCAGNAAGAEHSFVVTASGNPNPYLNHGGITVLDSNGLPVAGSPFDPIVNYTTYGSVPVEGPMGFPIRMTLDRADEHL